MRRPVTATHGWPAGHALAGDVAHASTHSTPIPNAPVVDFMTSTLDDGATIALFGDR
jgi:hypothetical protein